MKQGCAVLVSLLLVLALSELYPVTVSRVSQNIYKVHDTRPQLIVETKLCYVYAYRDEAVLRYVPRAYDNELIFDDGDTCDVKAVYEAR